MGQYYTNKGLIRVLSINIMLNIQIKLKKKSLKRLFKHIKFTYCIFHVLYIQVDHNNTKHAILLRHLARSNMLQYESYGELKLNTSTYSVSNLIDLKHHEITLDMHLDQYDNLIMINNNYYLCFLVL